MHDRIGTVWKVRFHYRLAYYLGFCDVYRQTMALLAYNVSPISSGLSYPPPSKQQANACQW